MRRVLIVLLYLSMAYKSNVRCQMREMLNSNSNRPDNYVHFDFFLKKRRKKVLSISCVKLIFSKQISPEKKNLKGKIYQRCFSNSLTVLRVGRKYVQMSLFRFIRLLSYKASRLIGALNKSDRSDFLAKFPHFQHSILAHSFTKR